MVPIRSSGNVIPKNSNDENTRCVDSQHLLTTMVGSILNAGDGVDCIGHMIEKHRSDEHSQELIRKIYFAMEAGLTNAECLEIDLGEDGNYRLVDGVFGLSIIKSAADGSDFTLTCFGYNKLEQFVEKYKDAKNNKTEKIVDGFFTTEEMPTVSVNAADDEFEIIESPKNAEIPVTPDTPAYLDDGQLFGEHSLPLSIDIFLKQNNFNGIKQADETMVFKDFVLCPLMSKDDDVKKFVEDHKEDTSLSLIPYVLKGASLWDCFVLFRDHIVLLAVGHGKSTIVDPRYGLFYPLESDNIIRLCWQSWFDDINCGVFVYHMITSAITASQNGTFTSDLEGFFKPEDLPQPTQIRQGMRELYLSALKTNEVDEKEII